MHTEPELKELSEFLSEFNKETDRGAVLNAAAVLDEWLLIILKEFLADNKSSADLLNGFNAPLGTFSARVAAAHSLGLIQDNEFREITIIRKIRNEFGHSWREISFETQKISDLANNLPWLGPKDLEANSGPRTRFNFAVAILLSDLLWRSRLVKKNKIEAQTWPNKSRP
ncbi:transcriptional regulator [Pseudomonas fluorescens]|uniref:transcriptional regulator n=1 Tax=Pseudomonas fluorescens TaxID=294 RepID=UPI001404D39E|nr:transcriptional regulator [Pseudomonas fluorescens]NHN70156.1 transcriptional regulator [Pseudomonas fluorescens]